MSKPHKVLRWGCLQGGLSDKLLFQADRNQNKNILTPVNYSLFLLKNVMNVSVIVI